MSEPTGEAAHEPDRMSSGDEEEAAEASAEQLQRSGEEESVARHYQEMARLGVEQRGEGRIE